MKSSDDTVISLAAVRERKAQARAAAEVANPELMPRRPWPRWTGLAAALVVGVLGGSVWMTAGDDGGFVATDGNGSLVARGELAGALTQQLASDARPNARVRIGVSFAARGGGYCRSFKAGAVTGLACRAGDRWRIPVLRDAPAASGATVPAAVLEVIDERIEGMTLDAAAERAARDRGWKR